MTYTTGHIDKQALIDLLDNTENEERRYILNYLLTSYKFDLWQTIEEFKANPVVGNYFIKMIDYDPEMAIYHDGFFSLLATDTLIDHSFITHVMLIKTPEAPK